ncbi:glutamate receptor, partial [Leptotrombidium deliense]
DKKPNFRVTTILNAPYVVSIRDPSTLKGAAELNNKIFDGYLIELLNILAKEAGFTYNISVVKDSMYGIEDENGEWRGLIGEIQRGEADLAVADLTITSQREQAVDFSFPYMTFGIGLVIKKPPYFLEVGKGMVNNTIRRPLVLYPLSSIEDLPYQESIEYGAVRTGTTLSFFMTSEVHVYKMIGDKMIENARKLPFANSQGVHMVKESNGRYAFFAESSSIEYILSKECDLMQFGKIINSGSYGIAMKKNFEYKTLINAALVSMQEKGILRRLKNKWFPKPVKCVHKPLDSVYSMNALNLVLNDIKSGKN